MKRNQYDIEAFKNIHTQLLEAEMLPGAHEK